MQTAADATAIRSLPPSRAYTSGNAAKAHKNLQVIPSRLTSFAELRFCASEFSDVSTGRQAPLALVCIFKYHSESEALRDPQRFYSHRSHRAWDLD